MIMRRQSSGRFELPVPAAEAIDFFTPEGERSWVPGWDPTYPAAEPTETPGTVFTTIHGHTATVWVIEKIDRNANTSAYSRITPQHHAGTVRVRCDDQFSGHCIVSVEYDMTALSTDYPQVLDAYNDDAFAAMMDEWATGLTAKLVQ